MNLFAGKQWRHGHRQQTCDTVQEGVSGMIERAALKYTHYYMQNRWPVEIHCMTQGAQTQCSATA